MWMALAAVVLAAASIGLFMAHLGGYADAEPAATLAEAPRQLSSDPRWHHPYFHAGLVIRGDWRW